MKLRSKKAKRTGSVLVEYALLVAGIVLVSVVAIALLGDKVRDVIGVAAGVLPSAHANDNKPIAEGSMMPLDTSGDAIKLNSAKLVDAAGIDRMETILGAGGGEILIVD